MGNCTSPYFNILVLGLENSGKTTLLQCIDAINAHESIPKSSEDAPTIGINQTACELNNGITLLFTEVSANAQAQRLWGQFLINRQALVWVIDVSTEQIHESLQLLKQVLDKEGDPSFPKDGLVIIYGNKFDIWLQNPKRSDPESFEERLKEEVKKLDLKHKIKYHWGSSLNVNAVRKFCLTLSEDIAEDKDPVYLRVIRKVLN